MTQEAIADSYQNAIKLVRKAKRQRADLASVRETLDHVLKHLTAQAQHELAPTFAPPTDTNATPAALKFLLIDKASGKAQGSFASLDEAKENAKNLQFYEVWSDGTRMLVVGNGYVKQHAARG